MASIATVNMRLGNQMVPHSFSKKIYDFVVVTVKILEMMVAFRISGFGSQERTSMGKKETISLCPILLWKRIRATLTFLIFPFPKFKHVEA